MTEAAAADGVGAEIVTIWVVNYCHVKILFLIDEYMLIIWKNDYLNNISLYIDMFFNRNL